MVSLFLVGPVAVRALVSFSGRFVGTPSVVRAVFCERIVGLSGGFVVCFC